MKKRAFFLSAKIIAVMILVCACSGGQETEEVQEKEASVPEEQAEAETGFAVETEEKADTSEGPDLNHNGIAEEIFVSNNEMRIWENSKKIAEWYVGSANVFLYTLDGEDYVLCYGYDRSEICQENFRYYYKLCTVEENNKISVVRDNDIYFDINFPSIHHKEFDPKAIADFMDEVNDLLAHSRILRVDDSLQKTFEKEGRQYDSLSWLDEREPVFVRDADKSLSENLEDFQSAMISAYKSIIPEEIDSLPITETLEMRFSSGAGAWATMLTLNPDGSFVGDYLDTNVGGDYPEQNVCQFHGRFGKVEKLTENAWLLTLEELELDTGHDVGEEWYVTDEYGTVRYISREPYGFNGEGWKVLEPGAQFILYSPDATGHEPGTELYGAEDFQTWDLGLYGSLNSEMDTLGCWGLENLEMGYGFFEFVLTSNDKCVTF